MKKGLVSKLLRDLYLLNLSDKVWYYVQKLRYWKENNDFKRKNPKTLLPSDYLIYESFQLNYKKFHTDSINTAKWLIEYFKKYKTLKGLKILDWGCGPARLIRHFPDLINKGCKFYGTDNNKKAINWCKENISNVQFSINQINSPLSFQDNFFDIIFGVSVFTHLSKQSHFDWFNELIRITKKHGIILLTTSGNAFKKKLISNEIKKYDNGELIIRGRVKEGSRIYSAFHPKKFMLELFKNTEILEHVEGGIINNKPQQDIWIIEKKY